MTNEKHTPGPWRIDYDGVLCAPADKENGRPYDKTLANFPWSSFSEFNEPENKANARLIAASPVLLSACQTAFDALGSAAAKDPTGPQAKALAQLRTAIYTAIPE